MNAAEPIVNDYTTRHAAVLANRIGLVVVPPKEDGTKMPVTALVKRADLEGDISPEALNDIFGSATEKWTWSHYRYLPPSRDQLRTWYRNSRDGIGVLTGDCSGNLECLDFDNADTYRVYRDTAESIGLGDLIDRIEAGYLEFTPDRGAHWLYYCEEIQGNTKLASRPDAINPRKADALIETRGLGGYVVCAPSGGKVHPSGRDYTLISGGFESIVTITPDERRELLRLAAAFDEMPKAEPVGVSSIGSQDRAGSRPGDDYNAKTRWSDLLEPQGWTRIFSHSGVEYWRRPGKDRGISATVNYENSDLLYVFTTSTVLESERSYDRFGFYAFMEHGGDFGAATRALGAQGYGEKLAAINFNIEPRQPDAKELTAKDYRKFPHSDVGAAQRFALRYGSRMRYCFAMKKWLVWDGTRWKPDAIGSVVEFAKETARKIHEEAATVADVKVQETISKFAMRYQAEARLSAMIKLARSEPGIPILPHELDANPWQFNVLNGTINLTTGELEPHRQADLITRVAPIHYDRFARLPLWDAFLDSVTEGDVEVQDFLQRAGGYSLTGDTREEKLFFVHGPTNSGKSTFAEAVKVVLGDYAITADFEAFLTRSFTGGPRPDIARLAGSRFVASIEVDEGKKLAEGLVKMITGGDTVTARRLYQEEFEFKPGFKLWLVANHAPVIADDDDAMWRRIVRVPFDHTIPKDQRDPTIKQRLTDPCHAGPAILAWLVEGCLKWRFGGLAIPKEIERATAEYRSDMDPMSDFIDTYCVMNPELWTSSKTLRSVYEEWGKEEGVSKDLLKGKAFAERLTARGCTPKKAYVQGKQLRGWLGIGIRDAESQHTLMEDS